MQASRPLRIAATRAVREGNELLLSKANPALMKTWKSYTVRAARRARGVAPASCAR